MYVVLSTVIIIIVKMHLVIVIMNYVMLENNSDTRIYDTFNKM